MLGGDKYDVFDALSANSFDSTWAFRPSPQLTHDYSRLLFVQHMQMQQQLQQQMQQPLSQQQQQILSQKSINDDLSMSATSTFLMASAKSREGDRSSADLQLEEEVYIEDEDFVKDPEPPLPVPGRTEMNYEDDLSFIQEDNEGDYSLVPPSQCRSSSVSQSALAKPEIDEHLRDQIELYHQQRNLHYQHFLAFASSKARLSSMMLHELRSVNEWFQSHVETGRAGRSAKTLLSQARQEESGKHLLVKPSFSIILVNSSSSASVSQ